jgi:hypothetical protein
VDNEVIQGSLGLIFSLTKSSLGCAAGHPQSEIEPHGVWSIFGHPMARHHGDDGQDILVRGLFPAIHPSH